MLWFSCYCIHLDSWSSLFQVPSFKNNRNQESTFSWHASIRVFSDWLCIILFTGICWEPCVSIKWVSVCLGISFLASALLWWCTYLITSNYTQRISEDMKLCVTIFILIYSGNKDIQKLFYKNELMHHLLRVRYVKVEKNQRILNLKPIHQHIKHWKNSCRSKLQFE